MKKLFLFSVIAGALASCSSVEIAKRQHRSGHYVSFGNKTEVNKTEAKVNQNVAQHEVAQTSIEAQEVVTEEVEVKNNVVVNDATQNNVVSNEKNTVTPSKSSNQNVFVQNLNEEKVESKKSNFVQKLTKKSIVSKLSKQADITVELLLLIILAIIIPPIAVGLKKNWALIPLLINILLLLIGWFIIPGVFLVTSLAVIHALLVVFDIL